MNLATRYHSDIILSGLQAQQCSTMSPRRSPYLAVRQPSNSVDKKDQYIKIF